MKSFSQSAEHRQRLASGGDERSKVLPVLIDYLQRTGMTEGDFARRIGYAHGTMRMFTSDRYHHIAGSSSRICRAITDFIKGHPVAPPTCPFGELYETANVKSMRQTFQALLRRPVAYMIYGAPGSQKTYALEWLVAELNRNEMLKNGDGDGPTTPAQM